LLNTDGQLIDSNQTMENFIKVTKPSESGNLPVLNNSGQIVDSGFSIDDIISSSSNILWSSKKINDNYISKTAPIIQNSLLVKSQDGNLLENSIIIDDSKSASATVLWTSDKIQQNFITLPLPNTEGNFLQYDSTGKIISAKPKLTFFSLLDNTWSPFSTDLYITAIVVKTDSTYCINLASSIDFIPAHKFVLTVNCVFAQGINTPTLVAQKKLHGTIPYYRADSINICLLGSEESPWQFTADDKIDIFFVDKTNKACFKICCIIKGYDTSNIVTIERIN